MNQTEKLKTMKTDTPNKVKTNGKSTTEKETEILKSTITTISKDTGAIIDMNNLMRWRETKNIAIQKNTLNSPKVLITQHQDTAQMD